MMLMITITYHYERYHTGNLNTSLTRKATVYADTLKRAVTKIKEADKDYICIADNGVEMVECAPFVVDGEEIKPLLCNEKGV